MRSAAAAVKRVGFDFSGTLVEDRPKVYEAGRRALESFGCRMPPWEEWRSNGCANAEEFLRRYGSPVESALFKRRMEQGGRGLGQAAAPLRRNRSAPPPTSRKGGGAALFDQLLRPSISHGGGGQAGLAASFPSRQGAW